jgi:hypothetical protein
MSNRNQKVLMAGVILAAAASSFGFGARAADPSKYQLDIVDPANQATVFNNSGDVSVRVTAVPDLANGDQVELLVDGVPAAPPSTTLDFPLSGLVRGTHMLQARIIDATGNVGSISPSSTVYIWEASRLFPVRRGHK